MSIDIKEMALRRAQLGAMTRMKPSLISKFLSGFHNFIIVTLMRFEEAFDNDIFDVKSPKLSDNSYALTLSTLL